MDLFNQENNGAIFSPDRKYRYTLWRIWDKTKPLVMFIGLNPSTADEKADDPTIRRVKKFAFDWGYGGVYMLNLFAYVTTDPKELKNSVGVLSENTEWLIRTSAPCNKIIFAWGSFKEAQKEGLRMAKLFYKRGYALTINKDGSPRHPLYVKGNVKPIKIKS